jgi:hypothetical protein
MRGIFFYTTLISLIFHEGGAQWKQINGPEVNSILSMFTFDSLLLVSSHLTYSCTGYDRAWNDSVVYGAVLCAIKSDSHLVVAGQTISYSADHGQSWTESTGLRHVDLYDPGRSISYQALFSHDNSLYAQYHYTSDDYSLNKMIRSTDNGATWFESWAYPTDIVADLWISADSFFIVYKSGTGFLRKTTGNIYWDSINTELGNVDVRSILIDSDRDPEGYPILFALTSAGLYRSSDYGVHWTLVSSMLDLTTMQKLWSINGYLYASSYSGIYNSSDKGIHWTNIDSGLTKTLVTHLAVYGNDLLAATNAGLWRRPLSEITSVYEYLTGIPADFALHQNYPNPFNSSTVISFTIPYFGARNVLILRIFDMLGREIRRLVCEPLPHCRHNFRFDATGLATGLYFYHIQSGTFADTKKMMYIK